MAFTENSYKEIFKDGSRIGTFERYKENGQLREKGTIFEEE